MAETANHKQTFKMVICDICGVAYRSYQKPRHEKSEKHRLRLFEQNMINDNVEQKKDLLAAIDGAFRKIIFDFKNDLTIEEQKRSFSLCAKKKEKNNAITQELMKKMDGVKKMNDSMELEHSLKTCVVISQKYEK